MDYDDFDSLFDAADVAITDVETLPVDMNYVVGAIKPVSDFDPFSDFSVLNSNSPPPPPPPPSTPSNSIEGVTKVLSVT